jgi:hypothetical protein
MCVRVPRVDPSWVSGVAAASGALPASLRTSSNSGCLPVLAARARAYGRCPHPSWFFSFKLEKAWIFADEPATSVQDVLSTHEGLLAPKP